MACNCGKPDCITCLIESSSKDNAPPLPKDTLDAIILVIRPPSGPANSLTSLHMADAHHLTLHLTNILQHIGLQVSVSTRKKLTD